MSQIFNALKKVQEQRAQGSFIQEKESLGIERKIEPMVEKSTNKTIAILIALAIFEGAIAFIICIVSFMSLNINKNEILNLVSTIKSQQKEVQKLTQTLNKNKDIYDAKVRTMESRLNQISNESKNKINSLTVTYNDRYVKLKEQVSDDKQEIKVLTQEIKNLKNKIQEFSPISQ